MARILVLDPDDAFRAPLCKALAGLGHSVGWARDGRQALTLIRKESPELLIVGVVLPEKDGREALAELRKSRPPAKVIVISGGGPGTFMHYLEMAALLGADTVLAKPFSLEVIIAVVNQLTPGGDGAGPAGARRR